MKHWKFKGLSSFSLHILGMVLMLCDHLWAGFFPAQEWLTCIGRMAFPIFSFMIVEGYFNTSNIRKYIWRLLVFAIISEIPFNLFYSSSVIYPFHQNVLWTFTIGLCSVILIEKVRASKKWWLTCLISIIIISADFLLGTVTMVDYYGAGVLTVLVFYFFRGKKWQCFVGQLVCMVIINIHFLGGYYYAIPIAGYELIITQQGFALFSLIPIWLYNGRQGHHSKVFQYICYAFYPVHMLMIYLIWQCAA